MKPIPSGSARPGAAGPIHDGVMPLTAAQAGQQVLFLRVEGGRQLCHRLAEMGLTPGVRFEVIARGFPGPFVVSLRGTRFMLGRGVVNRIYVRPCGDAKVK